MTSHSTSDLRDVISNTRSRSVALCRGWHKVSMVNQFSVRFVFGGNDPLKIGFGMRLCTAAVSLSAIAGDERGSAKDG